MNTPPWAPRPASRAADAGARLTLTIPADIIGDFNLGEWPEGQGPKVMIRISLEALARRIREAVDDEEALAELICEFDEDVVDFPGDPRLGERKIVLPLAEGDPSVTITVALAELAVLANHAVLDGRSPGGVQDPDVQRALSDLAALLRGADR
jgi:hypothetical protein